MQWHQARSMACGNKATASETVDLGSILGRTKTQKIGVNSFLA